MRSLVFLVAMAVVCSGPAALAHTIVTATSISDHATVPSAPGEFTVTFSGPTGLANVTLTNAASESIALDYAPPRQMATSFTIPLPRLRPGAYTLSWLTIARDGHAMHGSVRFTIAD